MRNKLAPYHRKYIRGIKGTLKRWSTTEAGNPVILITDIRINSKCYIKHVWINDIDKFIGISSGTLIQFDASVFRYRRKNGSTDYSLTNARNVKIREG